MRMRLPRLRVARSAKLSYNDLVDGVTHGPVEAECLAPGFSRASGRCLPWSSIRIPTAVPLVPAVNVADQTSSLVVVRTAWRRRPRGCCPAARPAGRRRRPCRRRYRPPRGRGRRTTAPTDSALAADQVEVLVVVPGPVGQLVGVDLGVPVVYDEERRAVGPHAALVVVVDGAHG